TRCSRGRRAVGPAERPLPPAWGRGWRVWEVRGGSSVTPRYSGGGGGGKTGEGAAIRGAFSTFPVLPRLSPSFCDYLSPAKIQDASRAQGHPHRRRQPHGQ